MFINLRPYIRLFLLSPSQEVDAILVVDGERREMFSPLTEDDLSALRSAALGKPATAEAPVLNWLVTNGWATWSRQAPNGIPPGWPLEWSRQLSAYSVFCTNDAAVDLHRKVAASRVLIVGVGGAGNHLIQQLLGLGVRRFALIDEDRVELSNLNRQVLFRRPDIGLPKVCVAAREIRLRAPDDIEVTCIERDYCGWQLEELHAADISLALVSADDPQTGVRRHAAQMFFPARVPYAFLSYRAGRATLGPVVFDQRMGCGCCGVLKLPLEHCTESVSGPGVPFVPPSSSSINATLAALLIERWTRWLAGVEAGCGTWAVDLGRGIADYAPLLRLSSCPVCGTEGDSGHRTA